MTDRSARFQHWFQIISNIAIISGLAVVVYELNQSKQLAWGQMAESTVSRVADRNLATMGENPQEALAKAVLHPADLTEEDAVTLDAYYMSVVIDWTLLYGTSEIAGIDRDWRRTVRFEAAREFSSDPGRRWLKAWAEGIYDWSGMNQIAELALEAVRDEAVNHFRSTYELLLANE